MRTQRGYPRSAPDNCQLPTDNRHPPPTTNHHQPPTTTNRQPSPTANRHQPPTANQRPDGPKNGQKWKFSKVVPDPWGGSNGPFWAILGLFYPVFSHFQPYLPILAQFLPGFEAVMESNMGPKTVKNGNFQKVDPNPWGGSNGPLWAILDLFSAIFSCFGPFWSGRKPGLDTPCVCVVWSKSLLRA